MVNEVLAVYNKTTGALELGPESVAAVWSGFSAPCATYGGGDVVVLYDQLANRWLISEMGGNSSTNFFQCIAVSQTADATGSYYRYAYSFGQELNDYPKFGIWPDAYYYSANIWQGGTGQFEGARACAFDRNAMLNGQASASMICFQNSSSIFGLLPANLDGYTLQTAGEPDFFVDIADTSHLNIFQFHVDFNNPANSTFSGPTQISVASFSEVSCSSSGNCIPQPSTSNTLDSLSDRLMFPLAYRNFGDHESLVVNHTVAGPLGGPVSGVRWYEIRNPASAPIVYQQGTVYDSTNVSYWMGSIAMDKTGDIALGVSASGTQVNPSIYALGHASSDPLNSMSGPLVLASGNGVQNTTARWGDYSSMTVDPSDDCTFWYTQEFYNHTNNNPPYNGVNWVTHVSSLKFDACGTTAPAGLMTIIDLLIL